MPPPRGAKPKPTHLKLVKGTTRKDRMNKHEPKIIDLGPPVAPEHLTPEAREEWLRVSKDLYDAGLLTIVDRAILSAYCQAYGRWVVAEKTLAEMAQTLAGGALVVRSKNGGLIQNPIVSTANRAMADVARYAHDLGMTPSSRARVMVRPPNAVPELADKYFD
jgi:P27 family predicted phage terminase small subunit